MTVSATSSSVVLLSSPVDPAKIAAPASSGAGAKANGDEGVDGFQLLLAQATEGASATTEQGGLLTGKTPKTPTATTQAASEDGNALPLLADLLPLAQTAAGGDAKTSTPDTDKDKTTAKTGKGAKDGDDKTDAAVTLLTTLPIAPLPTPAPVALPAGVALTAQPALPATSTASTDPLAQAAAVQGAGQIVDDGSSDLTAQVLKGSGVGARATDAKGGSTDATAAADASTDSGIAALIKASADNQTPTKTGDESKFDALIKQLDTTASSSSASSTTNVTVEAGKALQQPAQASAANNNATATVSIPVAADGWTDAVTDKVMWFSANKINSAEIHLNPPDLGPLQVRISTQHDQTTVYFTSQHAAVRDALDQALPRLRDMMNSQGMQLLDAGVGGQSTAQQQNYRGNSEGQARSSNKGFFGDSIDSAEPIATTSIIASRLSRSAIDAYA
ncbi:MAG: hypothetical protein JWM78_3043 [Verrucomicrobiaceae bacterium]|nr:hypothetical protein [Verrucomicrobiaceae bacterium]